MTRTQTQNTGFTIAITLLLVAGFSVAPAVSSAVLHLVPDLVSEDRDFETVVVEIDDSGPGSHATMHFEIQGSSGSTVLFGLETTQGELVMAAYNSGAALYVFLPGGGSEMVSLINTWWHRVDILLGGDEYEMMLDGKSKGRFPTHVHATEAVWADRAMLQDELLSGSGNPVNEARQGFLPLDARFETFTDELDPASWTFHGPSEAFEIAPQEPGELGPGRLQVRAAGDLDSLAYMSTPLDGPGDGYIAEVSFRPWRVSTLQPDGVPDHQAVLAGLAGPNDEPELQWALVMAQDGIEYHRWSLYFIAEDGTRTQVAPTWNASDDPWQRVRVLVDQDTGTVTVQSNDDETGLLFKDAFTSESDRLAIGDVFKDHLFWTGGGRAYYDNFALYTWEGEA